MAHNNTLLLRWTAKEESLKVLLEVSSNQEKETLVLDWIVTRLILQYFGFTLFWLSISGYKFENSLRLGLKWIGEFIVYFKDFIKMKETVERKEKMYDNAKTQQS